MRTLLITAVTAASLMNGVAVAQTVIEQSPAVVPPSPPAVVVTPPPGGVLSTTRTSKSVDAYGNRVDSQSTTYRNANGVAQDSETTTRTVAPPPPPVVTSTTTTTTHTN